MNSARSAVVTYLIDVYKKRALILAGEWRILTMGKFRIGKRTDTTTEETKLFYPHGHYSLQRELISFLPPYTDYCKMALQFQTRRNGGLDIFLNLISYCFFRQSFGELLDGNVPL